MDGVIGVGRYTCGLVPLTPAGLRRKDLEGLDVEMTWVDRSSHMVVYVEVGDLRHVGDIGGIFWLVVGNGVPGRGVEKIGT